MATYREIHGKAVKSLSTDPSGETDAGQIWYNTSSDSFKSILNLEAWSSAAPLSQKRTDPSGFGIQTANVCATGNIPPRTGVTEEYNGTGWAAGGTASQAGQYRAGFGTLAAGAIAGARTPAPAASNATEEYDGSSWTSGGNLPASIYLPGNQAAGTQTAGLTFGGDTGPGGSFPTASYEYNGTGWTAGNSTNTARSFGAGSGSQTAAFFACGTTPPFSPSNDSVHFEQYDGTNWTTGPNLNQARISTAAGGDTTTGLVFGGEIRPGPAVSNKLEKWDGTSWTTSPATMGTGRMGTGRALGTGSATANMASGGYTTTPVNTTEEYNSSANVITAAAWSSNPTMNTGRARFSTWGTKAAAAATGSYNPPNRQTCSEWDGSTWSAGGSRSTATQELGSLGASQTGIAFGGEPNTSNCEEYDGSSWTAGGAIPTASKPGRHQTGTQTAGLSAGASPPSSPTAYDWAAIYNGASWTAITALPAGNGSSSTGTQTAACQGGPGVAGANTLIWNGASWSNNEAPNLGGTNAWYGTSASLMNANGPGTNTTCELSDGTAFATTANVANGLYGRNGVGALGTTGIVLGGQNPSSTPGSSAVEEYNLATTALNVKTLTQS